MSFASFQYKGDVERLLTSPQTIMASLYGRDFNFWLRMQARFVAKSRSAAIPIGTGREMHSSALTYLGSIMQI